MGSDPTRGATIHVDGPQVPDQLLLAALAGALNGEDGCRPLPSSGEVAAVCRSLVAEDVRLVLAVGDGSASTGAMTGELEAACRRRRIECLFLEVDLDGVIGDLFQEGWARLGATVRRRVVAGERVGIVSLGFLGAAETLAAQVLVEAGLRGCDALDRVDRAVGLALHRLPARRRRLLGLDPWQRDHVLARRPTTVP